MTEQHPTADERRLAELLGDPALWDDPDPAIENDIVAAIRREAATDPVDPAGAGPDNVVPISRARRWLAPVVAGAAAMLALVFAVGAIGGSGGPDGIEVALAGTDLAAGASADAVVAELDAGTRIVLDVRDLPPAGSGEYYEAWMRIDADTGVSAGTFHMRGGDDEVELWTGVTADEYPLLTVTIQEVGQAASSGRVVLRGTIGE